MSAMRTKQSLDWRPTAIAHFKLAFALARIQISNLESSSKPPTMDGILKKLG
jgi:hypothetical protein